MAKPASPVALAFHAAFERELLPLLEDLGLAAARPKHLKPGLLVGYATRALGEQRRLEATVWCEAARGTNLRFRFDVVEPINGVECTRQVALEVPWPDPSAPKPRSLDFSGQEFAPEEGPERLELAITFLAGAFASSLPQRLAEVPALSEAVQRASTSPRWTAAVERSRALWATRHRRGELDARVVPATVVFVGANLVSLDAEGARLTFKLDTRAFDRTAPVQVTNWVKTPAGSVTALRLINGARRWDFDDRGQLTSEGPA